MRHIQNDFPDCRHGNLHWEMTMANSLHIKIHDQVAFCTFCGINTVVYRSSLNPIALIQSINQSDYILILQKTLIRGITPRAVHSLPASSTAHKAGEILPLHFQSSLRGRVDLTHFERDLISSASNSRPTVHTRYKLFVTCGNTLQSSLT